MLMRKTEERDIRGRRYRVSELGGIKSREVQLRLLHCLGPSIGALMSGEIESGLRALRSLEIKDLAFLCDAFGEASFLVGEDGKTPRLKEAFDDVFAGQRAGDMWHWLYYCVEFNYADFLGDLKTRIATALRAIVASAGKDGKPSLRRFLEDSTGSSGDSPPTNASA